MGTAIIFLIIRKKDAVHYIPVIANGHGRILFMLNGNGADPDAADLRKVFESNGYQVKSLDAPERQSTLWECGSDALWVMQVLSQLEESQVYQLISNSKKENIPPDLFKYAQNTTLFVSRDALAAACKKEKKKLACPKKGRKDPYYEDASPGQEALIDFYVDNLKESPDLPDKYTSRSGALEDLALEHHRLSDLLKREKVGQRSSSQLGLANTDLQAIGKEKREAFGTSFAPSSRQARVQDSAATPPKALPQALRDTSYSPGLFGKPREALENRVPTCQGVERIREPLGASRIENACVTSILKPSKKQLNDVVDQAGSLRKEGKENGTQIPYTSCAHSRAF